MWADGRRFDGEWKNNKMYIINIKLMIFSNFSFKKTNFGFMFILGLVLITFILLILQGWLWRISMGRWKKILGIILR